MSKQRAIENWNKIRNVFQKVFHSNDSSLIDTAKINIDEDAYLQEVSQYKQNARDIFIIPPEDRFRYELTYQNSKLVTYTQEVADTKDFTTKGEQDSLAFVLSKAGQLYVSQHGQRGRTNLFFFHGSFLDYAPVEMAGLISIIEGKIVKISNQSGHYLPDNLDLYRGIKHIQRIMPSVFREDCIVSNYDGTNFNINEFIRMLETPNDRGILKYQELRNEKAENLRKYRKKIHKLNRLHRSMINGESSEEIDNSLNEAVKLMKSSATSSEILAIMSIIPNIYKTRLIAPIQECITRLIYQNRTQDAVSVIQEFLDYEQFHITDFVKSSIQHFADKNDINNIILIIGALPEERYIELLEPLRYTITKLTDLNNPRAIASLIDSLSDEVCRELIDITNSAIVKFAANRQRSAVRLLISALPELKQDKELAPPSLKQARKTLRSESIIATSAKKTRRSLR